jgi:hypothetical protein
MDDEGKFPSYYATKNGNEEILQEFFVNQLGVLLGRVLYLDQSTE